MTLLGRCLALFLLAGSLGVATSAHAGAGEVVCVSESVHITLDHSGRHAKRLDSRTFAVVTPGDLSEALAHVSVLDSYDMEPKRVTVTLLRADGSRKRWKLSDFTEIPYYDDVAFVSDARRFILVVGDLAAGDTLTVDEEHRVDPFVGFPLLVMGGAGMTYLHSRVTIEVPTELHPRYRSWNGAGDPQEERTGNVTTWTWKVGRLDPPPEEQWGPPPADLLPTVHVGVDRMAWGPSHSWEAIGASYWNKVRDRVAGSLELETLPERPEAEEVQASLEWVQDRVRYVAIMMGPGGRIPHEAHEVAEKQYGDCKDMSTLLLSVLNERRLPGYFALINTRPPAGWVVEPLPTLNYFNHAVVRAGKAGWWLDATDRHGSALNPRIDIQGAPALVVGGPNAGWQRVPMRSGTDNLVRRTVNFTRSADTSWSVDLTLEAAGMRAQRMLESLQGAPSRPVCSRPTWNRSGIPSPPWSTS